MPHSFIYLMTGIGLWKRKKWARTIALILGGLFVWYPVGLGLGLYAWLFLRKYLVALASSYIADYKPSLAQVSNMVFSHSGL